MKITYELDLNTFEAWSGAVYTLNRVRAKGKVEELENLLEECYPDGMDEGHLNDILWFEDEWIFENLGIRTESQIREELEEAEERLKELHEQYEEECAEVAEVENPEDFSPYDVIIKCAEIWTENYENEAKEIEEEIAELKEELENI